MQKRRAISLVLCIALLLGLACPVFAEESTEGNPAEPETTTTETGITQTDFLNTDASVAGGSHTLDAQVPLRSDKVLETGTACLLYEVNSSTLMFGENMDLKVYPGGFVKLMTALLAIEQGDLAQEITVTQEALDQVPADSSIQGFLDGEVLTLEQLLYSLIVQSANDAATVIADYIAGSQEAFIEAMNQKAAEIGCTGTNFTNVHGVYDEQQYTTPRDLAKIMEYGMQYDMFQKLLATSQYYIAETNLSEERRLDSNNFMISEVIIGGYYDGRVTGGKVSTNQDGRRSLVVFAEDNGLTYIGIVIDTEPEYSSDGYSIRSYREFLEMENMLDLGFENNEVKQILYEGQILNCFTVTNGENSVAAGPAKSVMSVLPKDVSLSDLTLRFQKTNGTLSAPVEKGQTLDILQVWYGPVCIAQAELVAMNSSAVATTTLDNTDIEQGINTEGLMKVLAVLGGILLALIGFVAILYLVRIVRRAMFQARRRRRRNSRRRSR